MIVYNTIPNSIIVKAREARKHAGLSQNQVAHIMCYSQQSISKFEQGKCKLSVYTFCALYSNLFSEFAAIWHEFLRGEYHEDKRDS